MRAYVAVWSEEVADGMYEHFAEYEDEDGFAVGSAREFDTAGQALAAGERMAAKYGISVESEDLCWDNEEREERDEVTRWADPYFDEED